MHHLRLVPHQCLWGIQWERLLLIRVFQFLRHLLPVDQWLFGHLVLLELEDILDQVRAPSDSFGLLRLHEARGLQCVFD